MAAFSVLTDNEYFQRFIHFMSDFVESYIFLFYFNSFRACKNGKAN